MCWGLQGGKEWDWGAGAAPSLFPSLDQEVAAASGPPYPCPLVPSLQPELSLLDLLNQDVRSRDGTGAGLDAEDGEEGSISSLLLHFGCSKG